LKLSHDTNGHHSAGKEKQLKIFKVKTLAENPEKEKPIMFDLNSNLVKEPLTRRLKAQFEYPDEGEAAKEPVRKSQSKAAPARKSARRPFWVALWSGKQANS
jgi:hypothetical protein